MKKALILAMYLVIISVFTLPLLAKHKIRKLTEAEIEDVNNVMTDMTPSKIWMDRLESSKDFKHTEKRSAKVMKDLERFYRRAEKGEIKNSKGKVMTTDWLENITQFDRPYWSDPNIIQEIHEGNICPLDGTPR